MTEQHDTIVFSLIITGRNDTYGGDFKERTERAINYFAHSAARLGALDKVEVVVCDWGSEEEGLSQVLGLTKEAYQIVNFVEVPWEVARQHNPEGRNFHYTLPFNVGLRHARGRYFGIGPSDNFIPAVSIERLLSIMEKRLPLTFDPETALMGATRRKIPMQFEVLKWTFEELDKQFEQNYYWEIDGIDYNPIHGGFGIQIFSRKLYEEFGGYHEDYGGWGFADNELFFRIASKYEGVGLGGLQVTVFDPELPESHEKTKKIGDSSSLANPIPSLMPVTPIDKGGLPDHTFTVTKGQVSSPIAPSAIKINLENLKAFLTRDVWEVSFIYKPDEQDTPLWLLLAKWHNDFFFHKKYLYARSALAPDYETNFYRLCGSKNIEILYPVEENREQHSYHLLGTSQRYFVPHPNDPATPFPRPIKEVCQGNIKISTGFPLERLRNLDNNSINFAIISPDFLNYEEFLPILAQKLSPFGLAAVMCSNADMQKRALTYFELLKVSAFGLKDEKTIIIGGKEMDNLFKLSLSDFYNDERVDMLGCIYV